MIKWVSSLPTEWPSDWRSSVHKVMGNINIVDSLMAELGRDNPSPQLSCINTLRPQPIWLPAGGSMCCVNSSSGKLISYSVEYFSVVHSLDVSENKLMASNMSAFLK